MREPHTTELQRVVGTGRSESLVSAQFELPVPALDILEWRRTVLIDQADASHDGVLIQGRLRTLCLYTTADYRLTPDHVGTETGTGVVSLIEGGRPLVARADIRFSRLLTIPNATPGMRLRVLEAYVAGEGSRPAVVSPAGLIHAVVEACTVAIMVCVLTGAEVELREPEPEQFGPGQSEPDHAGREHAEKEQGQTVQRKPRRRKPAKSERERRPTRSERKAERSRSALAGALPGAKMVRHKRRKAFLWVDPTRQLAPM
jgi:hypothetical protein